MRPRQRPDVRFHGFRHGLPAPTIGLSGAKPKGEKLTSRQAQIVRLIQKGKQTKEIARELGISFGTVKTHLALVYARTGARNRAALAGLGLVAM